MQGRPGTLPAPTNARSGLAASVTAADRVSGHKTQLYLVAASTGGPVNGSRCGFCDTTYNCSCVWNPEASFMTDRNERRVMCARGSCFPSRLAVLSKLFLCSAGQANINGAVSAAVLAEAQTRRNEHRSRSVKKLPLSLRRVFFASLVFIMKRNEAKWRETAGTAPWGQCRVSVSRRGGGARVPGARGTERSGAK